VVFDSLGEVFSISFLHFLDCSYLDLKLFTLYFFLFSALSHWGRGGISEWLCGCWAVSQSNPITAGKCLITGSEFSAGLPRCSGAEALLQEEKLRGRA